MSQCACVGIYGFYEVFLCQIAVHATVLHVLMPIEGSHNIMTVSYYQLDTTYISDHEFLKADITVFSAVSTNCMINACLLKCKKCWN